MTTKHACFEELFKQIPGSVDDIYVPIKVNIDQGKLETDSWAIRVHKTPNKKQTVTVILNYCPFCGQKLNDEIPGGMSAADKTLVDFKEFHPRAVKLLEKRKPFLVVANDEPYFIDVYKMIRMHEMDKGTWTDEDQERYRLLIAEKHSDN